MTARKIKLSKNNQNLKMLVKLSILTTYIFNIDF